MRAGLGLFQNQIICRPHSAVGTSGPDFHLGAGDLVEEEWCAPIVYEFAALIDSHTIFFFKKDDLAGVAAIEFGGDFAVVADWIAAESRAVVADGASHVLQHCGGCQTGERFGSDDVFNASSTGCGSRRAGDDFNWLGFA